VEQTFGVRPIKVLDGFSRSHAGLTIVLFLAAFFVPVATAESWLSGIRVQKPQGQETGLAVVTINGKTRRVMRDAVQAWPVKKGEHALILTAPHENTGTRKYRLFFFEGTGRQRREIGSLSFAPEQMNEFERPDGSSIFVLSGVSAGEPVIIVATMDTIHGRLHGAAGAKIHNDMLTYTDRRSGKAKTVSLDAMTGADMRGIYEWHARGSNNPHYVQFLQDGSVVFTEPSGNVSRGTWWTDGDTMVGILADGTRFEWLKTKLVQVNGIPASTRLVVRLTHPLSSSKNDAGDTISAVLISPGLGNGQILLPQGTDFSGSITKAHGVGWGVLHETAALTLNFNKAKLPNGQTLAVHTHLTEVQNSREKVNKQGAIQGIRSTGTLGHSAESRVASLTAFDPVAYLFTTVSATAALGFAEPEILYPSGTELVVQLTAPLITSQAFPPSIPALAASNASRDELLEFVRQVPFRTMTESSNKPSDVTNLLFIGSPEQVRRAFDAAGWVPSDRLTAGSTFETLKSISGTTVYNEAPMSTLLLDEQPPLFTFSKTTNTFSSRHHLRIFDPDMRYNGKSILTASSTQDIGIAFSAKKKTFIHVIDQYIDNERSKVVNDLTFTGCVTAMDMVPRSWVPRDAYNSTGDRLRTDGAIAVLQFNDCSNPRKTPPDFPDPPSRFERIVRDTMLTLRNDLWRGNLGYQGVTGSMKLHELLASRDVLKPSEGAWQTTDLSGTKFEGVGVLTEDRQPAVQIKEEDSQENTPEQRDTANPHRWDAPRYEIAVQGGYLRYPTTRTDAVGVLLTPEQSGSNLPLYSVVLADELEGGWTAGISFTTNTWRWVSNEFSYQYQRGKYRIGAFQFDENSEPRPETQQVGLVTRQFEYNVLVHARPRESRWRPYVAAGPVLQLLSLTDAPIKRAAGPFKLGFQNVGILKAAFDFGSTPPLEGGGIFQLGLQYGAGIKFRVHPRITLRGDFRETWSKNPEFIRDSYTDDFFDSTGYNLDYFRAAPESKFRQQRFTMGVAFTF
jgi:hypothetical protein